ncbi:MAG: hypothetical protein DWH97_08765 [Planctomycetota bacterium]|nr:MAG: hypothetical protein DWH97_08765 [Planctomycetota bacterium]RLS92534.1 MAG: hypothetical protein DWI12_11045 [Planctomycetota bacterium]
MARRALFVFHRNFCEATPARRAYLGSNYDSLALQRRIQPRPAFIEVLGSRGRRTSALARVRAKCPRARMPLLQFLRPRSRGARMQRREMLCERVRLRPHVLQR